MIAIGYSRPIGQFIFPDQGIDKIIRIGCSNSLKTRENGIFLPIVLWQLQDIVVLWKRAFTLIKERIK